MYFFVVSTKKKCKEYILLFFSRRELHFVNLSPGGSKNNHEAVMWKATIKNAVQGDFQKGFKTISL